MKYKSFKIIVLAVFILITGILSKPANVSAAMPDVSANGHPTNISPASGIVGQALSFSANVSNSGWCDPVGNTPTECANYPISGISTALNFPNSFQVYDSSNTVIATVLATRIASLAPGATAPVSASYTFNAPGTYSVRVCGNWDGTLSHSISEGDSMLQNNCGNNVTIIISAPVMSGIINPGSSVCNITAGASTCTQTLTWTTTNPVGTSAVTSSTGTPSPANGNNGSQSFTVPYNGGAASTFYLYNNGIRLYYSYVTPACAPGTAWDGSKCQTIPTPVNGVCNATHYACDVGTSGNNVNSTYGWTWNCNGSGGGMNAFCKENKPTMSGTLTPSSSTCTIAMGASTCTKLLTWTTSNPVGTSAVTSNTGTPSPGPSANNSSKTFTVPYNNGADSIFYLYNNAVNLATASVTPSCATGSNWIGSICASDALPLSISLGSTSYSASLPNHTISGIYTLTNGTSANTTCRLLDGSGTPLTTYAPCTGSISVVTPATGGSYGYSIQAFKTSTGETKISNAFTVNIIIPFATPPAPVITISANPAVITSGGTSSITWSATNVTQGCTASGAWSDAQQETGTIGTGVLPTGTYTYTLTCTGGLGRSGSGSAIVTVNPVVVTNCTNGTNNPPACNICTGAFSWNGSTCVANPVIGTFSSTVNTGNLPGSFSEIISNLSKNTTYYFRAVAQNSQGTTNGQTLSFTTLDTPPAVVLPSVTTDSATSITNTEATFNGNVDPNGTADTTRYFEWGTSALSLSNQTTHINQGTVIGTFSDTVSIFTKDTTYYFRAVATNSNGTVYGLVSSFKTTNIVDFQTPPKPVVIISASPRTVTEGGASVITYDVTNATHGCVKSGDWSGATEGSGTDNTGPLSPGSYTYTLTCTGGQNKTGSGSVTVVSEVGVGPGDTGGGAGTGGGTGGGAGGSGTGGGTGGGGSGGGSGADGGGGTGGGTGTGEGGAGAGGGGASGGAGSTGAGEGSGTGGGNTVTEVIGNTLLEIFAPIITPEVKEIITTTRKNIAEFSDTRAGAVTTTTVTALGAGGGSAIALVSVGGTVTSLADIPLLALRLWSMLLVSLGLRKKRAPWGTVYDSVTKQPLDPVYVILNDQTGKEIKTAITDLDGRFGFLVPPGSYQITTKKTNYQAPSAKLAGKTSDELYDNLYFGGEVQLGEDAVITKNIPMDPLAFDWNEFAKRDKKLMTFYSKNSRIVSIVLNVLFYVGLLSVVILFIAKPDKLNLAMLIVFGVLLVLHLLGFKPKTFGTITDVATKEPLSFAVVRVFRKGFPQELFHRVADQYGHYYCLLAKGEYYITIDKKNVDESYTTIFTSGLINARKGIINENFAA